MWGWGVLKLTSSQSRTNVDAKIRAVTLSPRLYLSERKPDDIKKEHRGSLQSIPGLHGAFFKTERTEKQDEDEL